MPSLSVDVGDAVDLAELLQFLADWLAADPGQLGASLSPFRGREAYDVGALRHDLARFTFLLGASDGERLFGPQR